MSNCCGPFKRGRPAKAVNPSQQCFADCCGNICPPEGCCDRVRIEYGCGCGCDCSHKGFNFGGLKFKKKRSKSRIPTFSKRTLAANGFTFADGTIPTSSSSSSSSSSCICHPFSVEIATDGCCLYLGPEGVEAVGAGVVTATATGQPPYGCEIEVLLNGAPVQATSVTDGDLIAVEVRTSGECECCETQRDCISSQSSLWVQKSNQDGKTITIDREAIKNKVRLAVERVRKRKKG